MKRLPNLDKVLEVQNDEILGAATYVHYFQGPSGFGTSRDFMTNQTELNEIYIKNIQAGLLIREVLRRAIFNPQVDTDL